MVFKELQRGIFPRVFLTWKTIDISNFYSSIGLYIEIFVRRNLGKEGDFNEWFWDTIYSVNDYINYSYDTYSIY